MKTYRALASLALLLPLGAQAVEVTIPAGTPLSYDGSTVYVVSPLGWRFESWNGYMAVASGGGLYLGGGISHTPRALTITRPDGQAFSVSRLDLEGHVYCNQSCYEADSGTLEGHAPGSGSPFYEGFPIVPGPGVPTIHNVSNPGFAHLSRLVIGDIDDPYILRSIHLDTVPSVPLPAPVWLLGTGLMTLYWRLRSRSGA